MICGLNTNFNIQYKCISSFFFELYWSTTFEGTDAEKRFGGPLIVISREVAEKLAFIIFEVPNKLPQCHCEIDPLNLLEDSDNEYTFLYLAAPWNNRFTYFDRIIRRLDKVCGMDTLILDILVNALSQN